MFNKLVLSIGLLMGMAMPVMAQDTLFQRIADRINGTESKILTEMRSERSGLLERFAESRAEMNKRFDELEVIVGERLPIFEFFSRLFQALRNLFWVVVVLVVLALMTRWLEILAPLFSRK